MKPAKRIRYLYIFGAVLVVLVNAVLNYYRGYELFRHATLNVVILAIVVLGGKYIINRRSEMKPDWENAPFWANYLAMDMDGSWYWYENEPSIEDAFDDEGWSFNKGNIELVEQDYSDWKESLERRPFRIFNT